jgi:hypothetical protein
MLTFVIVMLTRSSYRVTSSWRHARQALVKNIGGQGGWGILRWILHRLFGYAHRSSVRMATSMVRCSGGFATGFRLVWL